MTTYHNLQLQLSEHSALLTLQNPPAHTWTLESLHALRDLISDLNRNAQISSLIISGDGAKFFSAGADLKLFADGDLGRAQQMASAFGAAFEALADFRGLSIAAINGYAMGGGLECALACDLRIAEQHAQLALPEASVGLLPCAGGTQNLTSLVGEAWAKRMILLGQRVDADTALRIGLVDEVVASGGAVEAAMQWQQQLAKQSPDAVYACKRLIQGSRSLSPKQMLPLEREAFLQLFGQPNQTEGVNAFLQKRAPDWHYPA